jgi:putative transposase
MKQSRFTEEWIIGVLREQEAGMKVAEVCRQYGISEPACYGWKAKLGGGMSVSDAKRLKQLEEENAKLKKLLAGAMLDVAVFEDLVRPPSQGFCRGERDSLL